MRLMAFRANDNIESGNKAGLEYLVGREFPQNLRGQAMSDFYDLVAQFGPVVESYPCWHPLVAVGNTDHRPWTHPTENRSYRGLDHFVLFRDAFLTIPYRGAETVVESVDAIRDPKHYVTAEILDIKLYHPEATPVIVKCEWPDRLSGDGTIPKRIAIPLLLEFELPRWRETEVAAETWETMRPYILGRPMGSLSSLFVNKQTGAALKGMWNSMIFSGMFGPIFPDR